MILSTTAIDILSNFDPSSDFLIRTDQWYKNGKYKTEFFINKYYEGELISTFSGPDLDILVKQVKYDL